MVAILGEANLDLDMLGRVVVSGTLDARRVEDAEDQ